jgi:hypothetical protein
MITKTKKRINISVTDEISDFLIKVANRDEMPVARKALDLIKKALEIEEDFVFEKLAGKRDVGNAKYLNHSEVWKD